ncbi:carboxypeptidase regulatory-like domain-containing protein [Chloroflexota bacterium]
MKSVWSMLSSLCFALAAIMLPVTAYAHGADIEYTVSTEVEVVATYDNGDPMDGGQVTIYAPDDAANPWDDPGTGFCDAQGKYTFTPDPQKPGTWDVQVRLAGHGDIVHIDVAGSTSGSGGYTALQIVLMSVCVGWGFVGTALYFRRRRSA